MDYWTALKLEDARNAKLADLREAAEQDMAYCFVCSRATDHFAEHDELVAEGKARYDLDTGSVYRV